MGVSATVAVLALLAGLVLAVYAVVRLRSRRGIATAAQRATYEVLHIAGLAAEPLRAGLSDAAAAKAVRHLRTLTGAAGCAVSDDRRLLAHDGAGEHHKEQLTAAAAKVVASGRSAVLGERDLVCDRIDCEVRGAVVVPLAPQSDEAQPSPSGALIALSAGPVVPGLVQATMETAGWVSAQLALAELDTSRARLARAELRALRAQISPHFIYNALNTIASFVRTDPDRARELVLEFADFTRYSFRTAGEYTTLADELRNIDRYLNLERARFGTALTVTLRVAPEVLNVVVPFLALQPLVENAVRHGFAGRGGGSIELIALDEGSDCVITVEDDGVGMDPDALRSGPSDALSDGAPAVEGNSARVGLTNVDHRLRAAFGNDYGLVVETAIGAGTKVVMRVPKFRSGVRAGGGAFGVGGQ